MEVQARRKQGTLLERSPTDSDATKGATERQTVPWENCCAERSTPPRRRLDSDHPLSSQVVRHCFFVSTAGSSYRGGPACSGEVVWARVPGTKLLRGKFAVKCLELVWLEKTEDSDEHLCGDEQGVRKFRTIMRQPETARWRREDVDKLFFLPSQRLRLQWAVQNHLWTSRWDAQRRSTRTPVTNRRNPVAAKPYEAKRRCTATGYCNDDEIGADGAREACGAAMQHGRPARTTTRWTLRTRAKTIMGLEIFVLEAMDDVFDATPGGPGPNPAVNPDESVSDDDHVSSEVTHDLNRLKALGRPCQAPSVDEQTPKRAVHGTRSNELIGNTFCCNSLVSSRLASVGWYVYLGVCREVRTGTSGYCSV